MSKHTPGPWVVHKVDQKNHYEKRCLVFAGPTKRQTAIAIIVPFKEYSDEEVLANASLVAAAPELLEALTLVLNDNKIMNAMTKKQAQAILCSIAKAGRG